MAARSDQYAVRETGNFRRPEALNSMRNYRERDISCSKKNEPGHRPLNRAGDSMR